MPRSANIQDTDTLWLKSDEDKPIESRPTFTFRQLNGREYRQVVKAGRREASDEDKTLLQMMDECFAALSLALVGWNNQKIVNNKGEAIDFPFNGETPGDIDQLIDIREGFELIGKLIEAANLSDDDKKKSESQP